MTIAGLDFCVLTELSSEPTASLECQGYLRGKAAEDSCLPGIFFRCLKVSSAAGAIAVTAAGDSHHLEDLQM